MLTSVISTHSTEETETVHHPAVGDQQCLQIHAPSDLQEISDPQNTVTQAKAMAEPWIGSE